MAGSLALVLVLIAGVLVFVNSINDNLREDTESGIKSMTKIGADYIEEYVDQDMRCLGQLSEMIALLPEERRLGQLQKYVEQGVFSRVALVYADGHGAFDDGAAIAPETDMQWSDFPAGSDISDAFFGWNGRKQVAMRTPVTLGDGSQAMLYGYVELEHYYVPAAMEFLGGRGFAYMIDGASGDYLVYTKNTVAQRTYASLYNTLEGSGNPEGSLQKVKELVEAGRSGSIVLTIEDTANYLYFTPVAGTPGWYMTAIVPLGVIQQARSSILFLMSVVCAFIFVCVIVLMLLVNSRKRDAALSRERGYRDALFGLIAENVEQVFMIYNGRRHRMEMVFQNSLQVLGIRDDVCREDPMLFFGRCGSDALRRAASQMLSGLLRKNVGEECRYNHPDGQTLWLKVKILRVGGNETENRYIVAVEDQTAEREIRKNLDDALAAAETASRAKSDFLSSMSHDIRTPMNAIMGMTELALLQGDCPPRVKELLQKISSSSRYLLSLVNDILDMSRIESGKLHLKLQPLRVEEEIQKVANIIRSQAEERDQTFTVKADKLRYSTIYGDALRVNQVLINILGNSVKFTPDGGAISWEIAELEDEPGWVKIKQTIRDSGIGMAAEFLPHLFDSFEQENRGQAGRSGSGLGMAIAKRLVDLMGGSISVDSAPGRGTTFVVELRFQIAQGEEGPQTEGVPLSHSRALPAGTRVLLVDDNSLNREIAVEMLSLFGLAVETAVNGAEAVQKFTASEPGHYRAVLMDIQMPVMDGYDATREIRALSRPDAKAIPIVAMTADAFAEDVQKAADAGMDGHVSKPVDFEQLYEILRELLQ
ncbi:ATP-binding protein [Oscillospiraceae bacterium 52-8]